MKYWEIIADNLKKRGWSYGYVSAIDSHGRTIWIADACRVDGQRFVVHAEDKLTAFLESEMAVYEFSAGFFAPIFTASAKAFETASRSNISISVRYSSVSSCCRGVPSKYESHTRFSSDDNLP